MKTVDQRMFEAFIGDRGMRLTADDIRRLLICDDAIGARVTNAACGGINGSAFNSPIPCRTWHEFGKWLKEGG